MGNCVYIVCMPRACMDTLTIVLYSLGQWSEYAPMSHSLEKVFTDGQLQDVSLSPG